MITEDYASFAVSKLLKEKGFNEYTYAYYLPNASFYLSPREIDNKNLYAQGCVSAPTIQMAMKWLREVHGLFIGIDYVNIAGLGFTYQTTILRKGEDYSYCLHKKHYEEACEAAIKYCLENLI